METKRIKDQLMRAWSSGRAKTVRTAISGVAVLMMVAGFGVAPALGDPLKVGHDQWIGYSGMFIAQAKGFFKEEGVEIEFVPFAGPGDSLPPLIAGALDLNVTTLYNLALIAGKQAAPLKVVYLIDASNGADAVVAQADISDMAGLKGKRVATTVGEVNHFLLIIGLEAAGLTESDVEIVDMSPDAGGAAFVAGQVEAAVTWEPWVTRALSGGGKVIFSSGDEQGQNLISDGVVVREEILKERASDVAAFIRAVDRGVQLLNEQPAEAEAILTKKLEASPEDIQGMLAGDNVYSMADNKRIFTSTAKETLRKIEIFLKDRDLIETKLDIDGLVDERFVSN